MVRARSASEFTSGGPPCAAASRGARAAVPSGDGARWAVGSKPGPAAPSAGQGDTQVPAEERVKPHFLKREASLLAFLRHLRSRKGRIPRAGGPRPPRGSSTPCRKEFKCEPGPETKARWSRESPPQTAHRLPGPEMTPGRWSGGLYACSSGTRAAQGHGVSVATSAGAFCWSPGSGCAPISQVPVVGSGHSLV